MYMMDPEFNDREFTEMGELIELFEKYLKSNEQHFLMKTAWNVF